MKFDLPEPLGPIMMLIGRKERLRIERMLLNPEIVMESSSGSSMSE
jgi:hypothetical protein